MKKLMLIIACLLVTITIFAQTPQESLTTSLHGAFSDFISYINWLYLIVFILIAHIANDITEASNTPNYPFIEKIPKILRVIIIAVLLMVLFAWSFKMTKRLDFFKMFVTVVVATFIYKIGIEKVLRFFSKLMGLKFDDSQPAIPPTTPAQ
jgi:hypothetical protein